MDIQRIWQSFLFLIFISLRTFTFAQDSENYVRITDDLFYSKISSSTYVIIHAFPWRCNSLFVLAGDKKGVLIDTPNETTGTESLLNWIHAEFGDLELVAINTGFHNDNLGGNEYLCTQGIKIYGAGLTARLIEENASDLKAFLLDNTRDRDDKRYFEGYKNVNFLPPTDTFNIHKGLQLSVGKETFEIYFPGESHTIDNVVVYIQNQKVLFGGCLILSMAHGRPGFIEYANMGQWPRSVVTIRDKYADTRFVVPGHGGWGGQELMAHTIEVLNTWNADNLNHE